MIVVTIVRAQLTDSECWPQNGRSQKSSHSILVFVLNWTFTFHRKSGKVMNKLWFLAQIFYFNSNRISTILFWLKFTSNFYLVSWPDGRHINLVSGREGVYFKFLKVDTSSTPMTRIDLEISALSLNSLRRSFPGSGQYSCGHIPIERDFTITTTRQHGEVRWPKHSHSSPPPHLPGNKETKEGFIAA